MATFVGEGAPRHSVDSPLQQPLPRGHRAPPADPGPQPPLPQLQGDDPRGQDPAHGGHEGTRGIPGGQLHTWRTASRAQEGMPVDVTGVGTCL